MPRKLLWLVFPALVACKGGEVTSEEEAEAAYLGLDLALEKALDLGLQGFNEADSANIADQSGTGDVSGTMTVGGQVDQGSSDNKGLRLDLTLVDYQDVVDLDEDEDEELAIVYDTDPAAPVQYDLQLRDMPAGTLEGTVLGTVLMEGDQEGDVVLTLAISGTTEDDGSGGVSRVEGETHITGTAESDYGTYDVDITR